LIDKLGTANYGSIVLDHFTYEDLAGFMNSKSKIAIVNKDLAASWNISKGVSRKIKKVRKTFIPGFSLSKTASKRTKGPKTNAKANGENSSSNMFLDEENADVDMAETLEDPEEIPAAKSVDNTTEIIGQSTDIPVANLAGTTETMENLSDILVVDEKVEVILPLGTSTYTKIQSSISFLYRECKMILPKEIQNSLSKYIKGSKRMGRKMKQCLALKITEGKKVMTREVYTFLCKLLLVSDKKEHLFAHLFSALDWYENIV